MRPGSSTSSSSSEPSARMLAPLRITLPNTRTCREPSQAALCCASWLLVRTDPVADREPHWRSSAQRSWQCKCLPLCYTHALRGFRAIGPPLHRRICCCMHGLHRPGGTWMIEARSGFPPRCKADSTASGCLSTSRAAAYVATSGNAFAALRSSFPSACHAKNCIGGDARWSRNALLPPVNASASLRITAPHTPAGQTSPSACCLLATMQKMIPSVPGAAATSGVAGVSVVGPQTVKRLACTLRALAPLGVT